jgi:PAS domain S-box-containing protein
MPAPPPDRIGAAMWRLASLQRRAAQIEKNRPKLLDDALATLQDVIAELTSASHSAAQAQEEAARSCAAAEKLRQQYQELYDLIPLPYLLTDMRGNILELNTAASRLLNLSRKSVMEKPLSFFVARDRGNFVARLARLPTAGPCDDWTLQIRPREKRPVWVTATVRVSAVRGDSEMLHWVLTASPRRPNKQTNVSTHTPN